MCNPRWMAYELQGCYFSISGFIDVVVAGMELLRGEGRLLAKNRVLGTKDPCLPMAL